MSSLARCLLGHSKCLPSRTSGLSLLEFVDDHIHLPPDMDSAILDRIWSGLPIQFFLGQQLRHLLLLDRAECSFTDPCFIPRFRLRQKIRRGQYFSSITQETNNIIRNVLVVPANLMEALSSSSHCGILHLCGRILLSAYYLLLIRERNQWPHSHRRGALVLFPS